MTTFWLHFIAAATPGVSMAIFAIAMYPPRWLTWAYWFPPPVDKQLLAAITQRSFVLRVYEDPQ